jgi:hypothetical protein
MARPRTLAQGAGDQRRLLRLHLIRLSRQCGQIVNHRVQHGYRVCLADIRRWLDEQPTRAKRPGGIGR